MPHAPQNFTEEQVALLLSLALSILPRIFSSSKLRSRVLLSNLSSCCCFQLECEAERRWPLFVYSILIVYGAALLIAALWTGLVSKWINKFLTKLSLHSDIYRMLQESSWTEACRPSAWIK